MKASLLKLIDGSILFPDEGQVWNAIEGGWETIKVEYVNGTRRHWKYRVPTHAVLYAPLLLEDSR